MKLGSVHFRNATAAAALLLFAGTANAQQDTQTTGSITPPEAEASQAQDVNQAFTRVRVVAGYDLVGKPVRDMDGLLVGEVEYLLIDPASGKLAHVVVGPGEMLSDQHRMDGMRAVPWNAIATDFHNTGEIRTLSLRINRDALEKAPMVKSDALQTLTSPQTVASITNYFRPLLQSSEEQAASGEQSATSGSETAQQPAGEQDTAVAQGQTGQEQANQQGTASQGEVMGYVLVGRSIVTALASPEFRLAQQLRGASVVSQDGKEIGAIERLVIDVERGNVAYALVSGGGFLGMGEEMRPVPIQALRWQSGETFNLAMNESDFATLPRIGGDAMPQRVRRADLEQLYQHFKVKPYWNAAG
jgi:sporulation protein YlmC with PRC-barrel domain